MQVSTQRQLKIPWWQTETIVYGCDERGNVIDVTTLVVQQTESPQPISVQDLVPPEALDEDPAPSDAESDEFELPAELPPPEPTPPELPAVWTSDYSRRI